LLPIVAIALHFGPGQKLLARDTAGTHLSKAQAAAAAEDWETAITEFIAARDALPPEDVAGRTQLAIAEARARIESGDFLEASRQLDELLERELAASTPRPEVVAELRNMTAESSYYTAWIMRLEGAPEDEWRPETEKARQQYRLLAETATDAAAGAKAKENLEAVIRLEQMDLSDLKGLPLPKKCKCCGGCCQRKREQRQSKCQGKKPSDARKDINSNSASEAVSHGKGS
jgi:hypothetical protein